VLPFSAVGVTESVVKQLESKKNLDYWKWKWFKPRYDEWCHNY